MHSSVKSMNLWVLYSTNKITGAPNKTVLIAFSSDVPHISGLEILLCSFPNNPHETSGFIGALLPEAEMQTFAVSSFFHGVPCLPILGGQVNLTLSRPMGHW